MHPNNNPTFKGLNEQKCEILRHTKKQTNCSNWDSFIDQSNVRSRRSTNWNKSMIRIVLCFTIFSIRTIGRFFGHGSFHSFVRKRFFFEVFFTSWPLFPPIGWKILANVIPELLLPKQAFIGSCVSRISIYLNHINYYTATFMLPII